MSRTELCIFIILGLAALHDAHTLEIPDEISFLPVLITYPQHIQIPYRLAGQILHAFTVALPLTLASWYALAREKQPLGGGDIKLFSAIAFSLSAPFTNRLIFQGIVLLILYDSLFRRIRRTELHSEEIVYPFIPFCFLVELYKLLFHLRGYIMNSLS